MSADSGDLIAVGVISGPHGIRGEVKVKVLTDHPERFAGGETLLLDSPGFEAREVAIISSREHKGQYLLTLEGIEDRNSAERLRGSFLRIRPDELKTLPPGEYYHFQLMGLKVLTDDGGDLGRVEEVLPTGSNLVLVVGSGKKEILLPFIDEVILNVDLDGETITVHLMEGLLPEE